MSGEIYWQGRTVAFRAEETVASALHRAGVMGFGTSLTGVSRGVFCGIGQCQNCLIQDGARVTEACLLLCRNGMTIRPAAGDADA